MIKLLYKLVLLQVEQQCGAPQILVCEEVIVRALVMVLGRPGR